MVLQICEVMECRHQPGQLRVMPPVNQRCVLKHQNILLSQKRTGIYIVF